MLSASRQVCNRTPMLTSPHRSLPASYPRASPRPAPRGLQPSRSLVWQARASLGTKGMRKKTRCRQTPTVMRFAGQGARTLKHLLYYGTTVWGGPPPRPARARGPRPPRRARPALPRAAAGSGTGWDVQIEKHALKKCIAQPHHSVSVCAVGLSVHTVGREVWLCLWRLCASGCVCAGCARPSNEPL